MKLELPRRRQHEAGVVNADGHVVGLDVGSSAVRVVVLAEKREENESTWACHGLAEWPLPPGVVVEGEVVDVPALSRALRETWSANGFGCRQVVLGISHPQIVVRTMQMPRLPPDQLAQALPFQAREVIALPIDDALLDFHPIDDGTNERFIDGLLVAAPKKPVAALVRAAEGAGLQVGRVDLASFAAMRALARAEHVAEAVVDVGAHFTNVIIQWQGVPRFVRTLPRGGQHLTERLCERTAVSNQEAEILKREIGLSGPNSEVAAILSDAVRPFIADIRGSIHYFSSVNSAAPLRRLTLAGQGAALLGLREHLADDTGLDVGWASPAQYLHRAAHPRHSGVDAAQIEPSAVAVGLAIGAAA